MVLSYREDEKFKAQGFNDLIVYSIQAVASLSAGVFLTLTSWKTIGEAFQVADDLSDALYNEVELGKPAGQDDLHGRPNAVTEADDRQRSPV